jgi:uncharacterized protein YgbK (DUF1537 family)
MPLLGHYFFNGLVYDGFVVFIPLAYMCAADLCNVIASCTSQEMSNLDLAHAFMQTVYGREGVFEMQMLIARSAVIEIYKCFM